MAERKEPTQTEKNIDKLKRLLSELFQFESSDLDFGIYRIINQKQTIIRKYIDKELVESISQQCKDINATSEETAEIFDHIYQFFSRYYDKGDYMPLHRHSLRDKNYAVPWNGEEVVLHWANKDQYYIKTGRNFKDYVFHDDENKFRIHFTIIDSQESSNNVKREDHYFIMSDGTDAVEYNDSTKEITCKFTYEPLTKEEAKRRSGAPSDPQKTFKITAENRIIELLEIIAKEERSTARKNNILTLLGILNKKERRKIPSAEDASSPTFLGKKLNRYVQENKSDYFIHKDLGGFLRQELDTYIKREMWDLNDLLGTTKEVPDPSHLKAYSDRIRIMRNISLEIITFLAQIEDFQKRLYLKKKFVINADYCITLDHIPKKFHKQILGNERQLAEWKKILGIGDIGEQSTLSRNEINDRFLEEHPYLVIDTKFFSDIKEDLIDSIQTSKGKPVEDLDDAIGGLIVKSENWQALNLLEERFREQVKCICIDPPYNTQNNEFLYKDNYQHSSWLAMMGDRVFSSIKLLSPDGCFFSNIDDNEAFNYQILLQDIFSPENFLASLVWQKRYSPPPDTSDFGYLHELIFAYRKSANFKRNLLPLTGEQSGRYKNPDNDPRGPWKPMDYTCRFTVEERPNLNYPIENPHTKEKIWPSKARAWAYSPEVHKINEKEDRIWWGLDGKNKVPALKNFLSEIQQGSMPTTILFHDVVGHTDESAKELRNFFPDLKHTVKPTRLVKHLLHIGTTNTSTIIDYFAGSGTTAHAIIEMNREDEGNRKYILVEMAGYFDTILKPRIEKVMFASDWKDGKPVSGSDGQSHIFKYMVLEQYEDTLNNIAFTQRTLDVSAYDDYLIEYMLDFETKESPCRFGITAITDPWAYQLKFYDENVPKTQNVDLIETFNYLLGLHVKGYRTFTNGKNRYRVVIGSKNDAVIVVIWRKMLDLDLTADKEFVENTILPAIRTVCKRSPEKIYINAEFYVKEALPIEPEFFGRMGG